MQTLLLIHHQSKDDDHNKICSFLYVVVVGHSVSPVILFLNLPPPTAYSNTLLPLGGGF